MKTHELADFLDHLRIGLDAGMTSSAKNAFQEAAIAFREVPNQTLKALVQQIQEKPSTGGNSRTATVDTAQLINRIKSVREGTESADSVLPDINKLTGARIDEVLQAFSLPKSGTKPTKIGRIRTLLDTGTTSSNGHQHNSLSERESALVEQGLQIFRSLREGENVSIEEVRIVFSPIFHYPKSVIEEITRRLEFTPNGTAEEMAKRLLSILEGLKLSQAKGDWILSGR